MASRTLRRMADFVPIIALAGGAVYLVFSPEPRDPIQGIVQATQLRIAPEVGGHLATVRVRQGDHVNAGAVVAELSALELNASLGQARASLESAVAERNNVYAGIRAEQVAGSASEVAKALSRLAYAQQQFARFSRLTEVGFSSQQVLDQAQMQLAAARADVAEATANYTYSNAGPTREERAIADARVSAAAAQVGVLQSRLQKTVLTAPSDGVVRVVAAEIGEAIRAGQTIAIIEARTQPWLSFNVREDRLDGLTIGTAVQAAAPGAGEALVGSVTELVPVGRFATWQAERAVGDHDRNTVRVRVDPHGDPSKLEPGMTVWLVR